MSLLTLRGLFERLRAPSQSQKGHFPKKMKLKKGHQNSWHWQKSAQSSEIFVRSRGICQNVGVSWRKGENIPFWTKMVRTKIKPDIRPEHHRLHHPANMPPLIPVKHLQPSPPPPPPPAVIELRNDFKFPMMSKRDSSNGRLVQTLLNGQFLAAFEIGGEHRVCLKLVIHQIPKQFSDSLINRGIATLRDIVFGTVDISVISMSFPIKEYCDLH